MQHQPPAGPNNRKCAPPTVDLFFSRQRRRSHGPRFSHAHTTLSFCCSSFHFSLGFIKFLCFSLHNSIKTINLYLFIYLFIYFDTIFHYFRFANFYYYFPPVDTFWLLNFLTLQLCLSCWGKGPPCLIFSLFALVVSLLSGAVKISFLHHWSLLFGI